MSYSVGLLPETAPSDPALAFAALDALIESSEFGETPHPVFVTIHDELTARYPCLCDLPDDEVDDCVWSDGPLINNFGTRQAVIGFTYSTVEKVLPFVVEVAHRHGVTVLDGQTGLVHRPPA